MIPDSVGAIGSFLLLTAPGGLYYLQRSTYAPSSKETVLAEASRVALASLAANLVAAVPLIPMWIAVYRRWPATAEVDPITIAAAAVVNTGVACGLVMLLAWFLRRRTHRGVEGRIHDGRAWHQMFVARRPRGTTAPPYLTVELDDGTTWRGTYLSHDTDVEPTDRSLALGAPGLARRRSDQRAFKQIVSFTVVLLAESKVRSIQIAYLPTHQELQAQQD